MSDAIAADYTAWMQRALALAAQAAEHGEVPVGALVIVEGQVVGEGWSDEEDGDAD